jgi:hypothetical protein
MVPVFEAAKDRTTCAEALQHQELEWPHLTGRPQTTTPLRCKVILLIERTDVEPFGQVMRI